MRARLGLTRQISQTGFGFTWQTDTISGLPQPANTDPSFTFQYSRIFYSYSKHWIFVTKTNPNNTPGVETWTRLYSSADGVSYVLSATISATVPFYVKADFKSNSEIYVKLQTVDDTTGALFFAIKGASTFVQSSLNPFTKADCLAVGRIVISNSTIVCQSLGGIIISGNPPTLIMQRYVGPTDFSAFTKYEDSNEVMGIRENGDIVANSVYYYGVYNPYFGTTFYQRVGGFKATPTGINYDATSYIFRSHSHQFFQVNPRYTSRVTQTGYSAISPVAMIQDEFTAGADLQSLVQVQWQKGTQADQTSPTFTDVTYTGFVWGLDEISLMPIGAGASRNSNVNVERFLNLGNFKSAIVGEVTINSVLQRRLYVSDDLLRYVQTPDPLSKKIFALMPACKYPDGIQSICFDSDNTNLLTRYRSSLY